MAVIREEVIIREKQFIKNYSDENYHIKRDGIEYEEANDPIPEANDRYYEETDEPIDDEVEE